MIYDKLSGSAGPVDAALERAAVELAGGGDANAIKQRAYEEIRAQVIAQADQLAGVPAGSVRGNAGDGGEGRNEAGGVPVSAGDSAEVAAAKARLKARVDKLGDPGRMGSGLGGLQPLFEDWTRADFEDLLLVAPEAAAPIPPRPRLIPRPWASRSVDSPAATARCSLTHLPECLTYGAGFRTFRMAMRFCSQLPGLTRTLATRAGWALQMRRAIRSGFDR
jgi:hypothetical protein